MRRIGKRVASSLIMAALLAGVASALTLAIGDPISGRRELVGVIASLLAYLPISIFINFIVGIPASLILRRLHLVRWYFWMPLAIILAPHRSNRLEWK